MKTRIALLMIGLLMIEGVLIVQANISSKEKELRLKKEKNILLAGYKANEFKSYDVAIKCFQEIINLNKDSQEVVLNPYYTGQAYLGMCFSYIGKNDSESASESLEKAMPHISLPNDTLAQAFLDLGHSLNKEKRYEKAIECYKRALMVFPYKFVAVYTNGYIGQSYTGLKDYDKAIEYYEQALEVERTLPNKGIVAKIFIPKELRESDSNYIAQVYGSLGYVWTKKQEYNKAIECFNKALTLNPKTEDLIRTNHLLSESYYLKKDYDRAIEHYQKVLDLNPKDSEFVGGMYRNIGECFYKKQDFVKAVGFCQKAIEKNSEDVIAYGSIAFYLIFQKKFTEAEQIARKAASEDEQWNVNLAAALLFQGKYEESEKIYVELTNIEDRRKACLKDFEEYAEAGIISEEHQADVEKIKKLLTK